MDKSTTAKEKKVTVPASASGTRERLPWHWGRWTAAPDDPFEALHGSIARMIESFRKDFGVPAAGGDLGMVRARMDINESDDEWEVKVELPGLDKENVEVSVARDNLRIRGEKKSESSGGKKDCHYSECSYGSVERLVPLPDGIDTDKVTARFRNGVLTVALPKTKDAKGRRAARKVEIGS